MGNANVVLQEALALAASGRPIFPVGRDKKPQLNNWPNKASTDPEQVRAWFDKAYPPNIALVTGEASGLFVLDVDGQAGLASLSEVENQYGALARNCVVNTPSGGLHLYFRMPDFDLRNSAGKLATALDIRANGGYVLIPPSQAVNREGRLGSYAWVSDSTLGQGKFPEAPHWLLDMLRPSVASPGNISSSPRWVNKGAYGAKALEDECHRVASAPQGSRNDTLNRAAFAVFQLVEGGEISYSEAESALREAALCAGLAKKEIQVTLRSARHKAVSSPRSAPIKSVPSKASAPTRRQLALPCPAPPLEIFPPKIQKLLKKAAVAFKHLPFEVPIVALLTMLSACIGQSRVLAVKDNWEEAANLYIALVANSGLGKSPCFKEFLKPLWKAEVRNKEHWDAAMAGYNALLEERRQSKDKASMPDLLSKPIRVQHIIEDATTEAIGGILADNPRGLLWYCDELSSIILNLDRYSNSKGGTKARLLSTYDRSPWKTSRRDQDKDQVIPSAALSLAGTVQPKVLAELFGQGDALSGFLPRFIFITARRDKPPLLTDEIFTGQEILAKITNHILGWPMHRIGELCLPHMLKMTPAAYTLYEGWHNQTVKEAWLESEIDTVITAKLVTQVLRLALLLHCLKAALAESDGLSDLDADTMQEAVTLGCWIREHQRRVWTALDISDEAQGNPLELAIALSALELEGFLAEHNWQIANDDFHRRVMDRLGQDVDSAQIGKAAARLGVKAIWLGKRRGKEFSPELLKQLKLDFYLLSC